MSNCKYTTLDHPSIRLFIPKTIFSMLKFIFFNLIRTSPNPKGANFKGIVCNHLLQLGGMIYTIMIVFVRALQGGITSMT